MGATDQDLSACAPEAAWRAAQDVTLRRLVRALFDEDLLDRSKLVVTPGTCNGWLPLWQRPALLFFEQVEVAPAGTVMCRGEVALVLGNGDRIAGNDPVGLLELLLEGDASCAVRLPQVKADLLAAMRAEAAAIVARTEVLAQVQAVAGAGLIERLRHSCSPREMALLLDHWAGMSGQGIGFDRAEGLLPICGASLVAEGPVDGRPLVCELLEQGGRRPDGAVVAAWFGAYASALLQPAIGLYLRHGVVLSADAQRCLMLFDTGGRPLFVLMREVDAAERVPQVPGGGMAARAGLIDTCFMRHLHPLALALTQQYLPRSTVLWQILREETSRCFDAVRAGVELGHWQRERDAILDMPWSTPAMLRMQLWPNDGRQRRCALPNPLVLGAGWHQF
ncbi:IucA/IucC family C-terminal-domain containing protein [Herbaspirillum sp. YR522]|uniref:IucA/IucC family C-terminal-domain containing protein n=1 Tax=Herbaspirillum sp. YR522 TaxID=1144342 RepID=UPI00026F7F9A|nr:ferric iron reductase [Herbaspirillum sp. YR522]EJN03252.1 siderophore synthetase component [Herbaspirillum sp. YR522]